MLGGAPRVDLLRQTQERLLEEVLGGALVAGRAAEEAEQLGVVGVEGGGDHFSVAELRYPHLAEVDEVWARPIRHRHR